MSVLLFGVSHRSAPVSVLEQLSTDESDQAKIIDEVLQSSLVTEAMVLAAEHDLATEQHSALAAMYHARIKRLGKVQPAINVTIVEPELDSKPVAKKRPALSRVFNKTAQA